MASKTQYVDTVFTEKRNFQSGEREIFLLIENSVEERIEALEKLIKYQDFLKSSGQIPSKNPKK